MTIWWGQAPGWEVWLSKDPVSVRWRFEISHHPQGYAVADHIRHDVRAGLPTLALAQLWAEFRAGERTT